MVGSGIGNKLVEGGTINSITSPLNPTSDLIFVSGTSAIATITPPIPGVSQVLFIVPTAAFTMTTTGNIAVAATAVANKLIALVYVQSTAKWYPSTLS